MGWKGENSVLDEETWVNVEADAQGSSEGMCMSKCPEVRGRKQGERQDTDCSIWNEKIGKNNLFKN